jgi:hypothetical protein
VALHGIQDKYYPSVAHDGGALKLLALLQAAGQGFNQDLHFTKELIDHQTVFREPASTMATESSGVLVGGRPNISARLKME